MSSAPPPSEREGVETGRSGVGVFRLAGWGWGVTIALVLLIAVVVVVGYLRDDPGRNPPPAGYAEAVCTAAAELAAGTDTLGDGVESDAGADIAAERIDEGVAAAVAAVDDLPEWVPGRALDELLGRQIITLTNGAAALREDDPAASDDLTVARGTDEEIAVQLDGRYGFSC